MTTEQKDIFRKIKQFILDSRSTSGTSAPPNAARLAFVNNFPARDRSFLVKLATELNLTLTWDEYDADDRNLATIYLPEPDVDDDDGSVVEADPEAEAAVDRVLLKYEKANVIDSSDDAFDEREKARTKEKMDQWKAGYYKVRIDFQGACPPSNPCRRRNWSSRIQTKLKSRSWYTATVKAFNG